MKKAELAKYILVAYWEKKFRESQSALDGSKLFDVRGATTSKLKKDIKTIRDILSDVLEEEE